MAGYASYVFNSVTTPCWIGNFIVDLGEVQRKAVLNCDPEAMGIYVKNESNKKELSKTLKELFDVHFFCESHAHNNIVKCARILLEAGADPNTDRSDFINQVLTRMGSYYTDNDLQNPYQLQPGSLALQCVRVLLCASAIYKGPYTLDLEEPSKIPKTVHARMSEIDTQCQELAKRVEQVKKDVHVLPEELVADFPLGKESDLKSAFSYDSGVDPKVLSDYQERCDRARHVLFDIRRAAVSDCNLKSMRLFVALETNPFKLNKALVELFNNHFFCDSQANPNMVECATPLLKAGANPNLTTWVSDHTARVSKSDDVRCKYVSLLEHVLTSMGPARDLQDPSLLKPNSTALGCARVLLRSGATYTGPFKLNVTQSDANQIPKTVHTRMLEVHNQCKQLAIRVKQVKEGYAFASTLMSQLIPGNSNNVLSYLLEDNQMNVVAEDDVSDCTLGKV